jgi:osmotically-inducible protein OsmY
MPTSANAPRSDRDLQQAVLYERDWTPEVDASHIGVAVTSGAVTLTGEVPTWTGPR